MANNKFTLSVLLSNCLVHFDNALYGLLAPIIATQYFYGCNYMKSLIYIYAIYFISLVIRPLAIAISGSIAKKISPMKLFKISIIGCSIGTFLTGFALTLKENQNIIIILILSRIITEASAAIEYTLSKVMLMQNKENKIMKSGMHVSSSMLGIILASCISIFANNHPAAISKIFFAASIIGIYNFFIRGKTFPKTLYNHSDLKNVVKNHWKLILRIASLNMFSYMTYILAFIFINIFAKTILNQAIYKQTTYFLVLDMALAPIIASIIKKYNPQDILKHSILFIAIIGSIFFIYMVANPSISSLVAFRAIIIIAGVTFACAALPYEYAIAKNESSISIIGIGSILGAGLGKQIITLMLFIWNISGNLYCIIFIILLVSFSTYYIVKKNES